MPNPATHIIVLDVGGSSIKSGIIGSQQGLLGQPAWTAIDSHADAETILTTLAATVQQHLTQLDRALLRGVALGFPGPFDYDNGVSYIKGVAKYEAIYGVDVRAELQQRLSLQDYPVVFRNDAEAAIVGEAVYGAGRGYQRLIGVTLGTGMGSSFVVDGQRVSSGPGVPPDGWLYPVLVGGTIADDVFSTRGLLARLQQVDPRSPTVIAFAEAARAGNGALAQGFAQFGQELGIFLEPFATAFGADAVLVLGGIANTFDLFGPALGAHLPVPALQGQLGMAGSLFGAATPLLEE